ncbi:hypothetical protein E3N88_13086 [Mikania micrantha]|uniref:Uncharacterized protein n=1 Tax=Mikania micrantha TaxID=192012 RepID=A0A5N6P9V8_9ASTR|nr:hypothetical protein E3N88_13086 [Mikania micrantha]
MADDALHHHHRSRFTATSHRSALQPPFPQPPRLTKTLVLVQPMYLVEILKIIAVVQDVDTRIQFNSIIP